MQSVELDVALPGLPSDEWRAGRGSSCVWACAVLIH